MLGAPLRERIVRQIDGRGFVEQATLGDIVSIHWGWACEVLTDVNRGAWSATPAITWPSRTRPSRAVARAYLLTSLRQYWAGLSNLQRNLSLMTVPVRSGHLPLGERCREPDPQSR